MASLSEKDKRVVAAVAVGAIAVAGVFYFSSKLKPRPARPAPAQTDMSSLMAAIDTQQPMVSLGQMLGLRGKSGYGSATKAETVAWHYRNLLAGKTVLVTGPTIGGIGFEAAKCFAQVGCIVILAGRSRAKGEESVSAIKQEFPSARVTWMQCDLASLKSVRQFALAFQQQHKQLHVLLNNAGIMATHFALTEDGYESQFAVDHLGHFLLTELLRPTLERTVKHSPSEWARIINVSSFGHNMQNGNDMKVLFDAHHFNEEKNYKPWPSYGRAKLANVMHAKWLAEEYAARASQDPALGRIRAFSLMPGAIPTALGDHLEMPRIAQAVANATIMKSIPQGAATSVWAAVAPELDSCSGAYLEDCNVQPFVHPFASDKNLMRALIATSKQACMYYM